MKTPTALTIALVVALPPIAWAQHNHRQHGQVQRGQEKVTKPGPSSTVAGNGKTCPVSGKPAKANAKTRVNGRELQFCCDRCIETYKTDPNTYAPAAQRQIHPQRVQVRCPVMGGQIDPAIFIKHNDEKISFCCKGCDSRYEKDPAKYSPGLKNAYTEQVHCPVTGEAIDAQHGFKDGGRTVYFCSSNCADQFKADPQEYAVALLPPAGLLAYGPTAKEDLVTCPVCPPGSVHKRGEVQTVVHDQKIYFLSSDPCVRAFTASPSKYTDRKATSARSSAQGGCCGASCPCTEL